MRNTFSINIFKSITFEFSYNIQLYLARSWSFWLLRELWAVLGQSCGALGGLLEPSGHLLGPLGQLLDRVGGVLGTIRRRSPKKRRGTASFGPSWVGLVEPLGSFWDLWVTFWDVWGGSWIVWEGSWEPFGV